MNWASIIICVCSTCGRISSLFLTFPLPQVRWADLEAIKEAEEIKKMGFVMGSGWTKPTEEEAHKLLTGNATDHS